ncbi:hypothetical protein ACQ4PT_053686 [Festuca glaucescens]
MAARPRPCRARPLPSPPLSCSPAPVAKLAVARPTVARTSQKSSRTGPTRGGARPGTERGVSGGQGRRRRRWRPARWYRGSARVKLSMAVEPSHVDRFLQRTESTANRRGLCSSFYEEKRSKRAVNKGRYRKDDRRCSLAPREESEEEAPHIPGPGPATKEKVLITGRKQEQAGQTQHLPHDLDDWAITKQATEYLWRLPVGAAPGDEDFWDYCDEEQLAKLNQRLALYRLKDQMLLSTGKERRAWSGTLHPEHTNIAGLDDYQRLVLRNDGHYGNWASYSLTYHTYQADLDYVRYCEEMSEEIKWVKDKVGVDDKQWRRYEKRACFQAMKIGSGYKNLFRHSVLTAYMDYMDSVQFDFHRRRDFDRVYLQIWKRVAKDKVRFVSTDYDSVLKEIYEQNMFPSRMGVIKLEVKKLPPSFHGWMKEKYDTYVACIDEKISEENCHLLIIGSMKEMFPGYKKYLDYVKKKIEVAARIGLIPKM